MPLNLTVLVVFAVAALPCALALYLTKKLRMPAMGWVPLLLAAAAFGGAVYTAQRLEPGTVARATADGEKRADDELAKAKDAVAKGKAGLDTVPTDEVVAKWKKDATGYAQGSMWVLRVVVIGLGIIVLSVSLGIWLAQLIRMPDYAWKLAVIFVALAGGIGIIIGGWPPKLGVDLGGGVILVYQVDPEATAKGEVDMSRLVAAIRERVNPGGQREIVVQQLGGDKIQITMPQVEEKKKTGQAGAAATAGAAQPQDDKSEAERVRDVISRTGTLVFRILANERDNPEIIERANNLPKNVHELQDDKGNIDAWWVPVAMDKPREVRQFEGDSSIIQRPRRGQRKPGEVLEILVINDRKGADQKGITGEYLRQATLGYDKHGQPCVDFTFNNQGASLFGELTTENLPDPLTGFSRKLGIILDGELQSAPNIQSTITSQGQITGSFTEQEVDDLVKILNRGSLPARILKKPVRDLTTGATLGTDTIRTSAQALVVSAILVPLFMLWYYRFSGLVANLALLLNMILLVAVMILVKAPFTLPALAGLALTMGMAVDNNVLIYERLREELAHGAGLRMAIRNSFHRAGSVIIDANLTNIIAAAVLWVVGTEQVKGFAVTFLLGALFSMWSALFVAHVVFDIAERRQWISKLKMMHIISGTRIDFMRLFPVCATVSALVIVIGLGVAGVRGKGLFDIDFTGGTSVQAMFTDKAAKDITIKEVREEIEKHPDTLPDPTVSEVYLQVHDESGATRTETRYLINTSQSDFEVVKTQLGQIFGDKLISNKMTLGALTPIPAEPASETAEAEKPAGGPPAKPAAKPEGKSDAKPDAKQQSRDDLPADTLLAMADAAPVLPARAEKKPAEAKAAAEAPAKAAASKPADKPPVANAATESSAQGPTVKFSSMVAGGTQVELKFAYAVSRDTVKNMVEAALKQQKISLDDAPFELHNLNYSSRDTRPSKDWTLGIKLPAKQAEGVLQLVQTEVAKQKYYPEIDSILGSVAADTRVNAIAALVASWVLIILYLWIRFQGVAFGLAAVIALVHDVLVMLGAIALSYYIAPYFGWLMVEPFKINLPIVAAFLTIIGFSVNDTIVIFDRIREVRGKDPRMTREMVNTSVNQTLSRTLLTSLTVLLVVVVLYVFGGSAVHGFAFALLAGVVTGTYSSIYVAAPILLWLIHPAEMKSRRETSESGMQPTR